MSNAARLVTAIAIVTMTLSAQPATADLEHREDPLSHEVTVVNATPEQQQLVDWALHRYRAAGLPIPAITITFHTTSDGCHNYLGYYDPTPKTLDMCNWGQHYKITPTSTLLHEMAHAWSFEHMTAQDRDAFTKHRGLDDWYHDGAWWHMGQEQAAEIIAWAIGGDEFVSPYLEEEEHDDLTEAYHLMTGRHEPERQILKYDEPWRTTPDDYCEIGTTCAYCFGGGRLTLGCYLERILGRHRPPQIDSRFSVTGSLIRKRTN